MTAIRAARAAEGRFVQIANTALQDERLSYQARGILAYVLSLPPDAHLTAALIEDTSPNGRESVRSALRELETCGYYRRTRVSRGKGKWDWEQVLSDAPMNGFSSDGNPSHETTSGNSTSPQVSSCDGNPLMNATSSDTPSSQVVSSDGNPSHKRQRREPKDVKDDEDSLRSSSTSVTAAQPPDDEQPDTPGLDMPGSREDVEQICAALADRLEQRFGKRPNITKRWRTAARLMIDNDGRTLDRVLRAIEWCQDNEFWQPNIQSVPKLREKYNQLAAQAAREQAQLARQNGVKPSTTDARVAQGLALVDKYEQQAAAGGYLNAGPPRHQITSGTVTS